MIPASAALCRAATSGSTDGLGVFRTSSAACCLRRAASLDSRASTLEIRVIRSGFSRHSSRMAASVAGRPNPRSISPSHLPESFPQGRDPVSS